MNVWGVPSGSRLGGFDHAGDFYGPADITQDGRTAVVRRGHDVSSWDLSTGRKVWDLPRFGHDIAGIAISPSGDTLAVGDAGGAITLFDMASGRELRGLTAGDTRINGLAFSPDGRRLAAALWDRSAKVWDVATGVEIRAFTGHEAPVQDVAFSPDGASLATASQDGTARTWDVESGTPVRVFKSLANGVSAVAVSADGEHVATGGYGARGHLWETATGRQARAFKHSGNIHAIAFAPDSRAMVTAGQDDVVHLWATSTHEKLRDFRGHGQWVNAVSIDAQGRLLATAGMDQTVRLWDLSSGLEVRKLLGHSDQVEAVAVSADGRRVASAGRDRTARLWDAATGKELRSLDTDGAAWAVALSPDARYLAAGADGGARLWDAATGRQVMAFHGMSRALAFSPDGKLLLNGRGDTPELVDLASRRVLRSLQGHTDTVTAAAFTADGRFILTGSEDATTRVWSAGTGKELCRLISMETGWAVVTPEGFFDGSPEGLRNLRWSVGLRSHPLEAFSEGYYAPGLLARVLAGEAVSRVHQPDISKGFGSPPLVRIVSPQAGAAVDDASAKVTVTATDLGGGIDEIRLYHNGKAVGSRSRDIRVAAKGAGEVTEEFQVELVEGANVFKAVALSRARIEGNPDETTLTLNQAQRQAVLHVLAVGINRYENSGLNLNFAQPDARAVAAFLGSRHGKLFAGVETRELFDAEATKEAIVAELKGLQAAGPQDVVVIYLAGHGDTLGDVWFLIPHELAYPEDENEVRSKALSSVELLALIKDIRARKVLILLDACKSGGALLALRGMEDRKALAKLARASGVYMVSASSKDQLAAEAGELGHGLFTYVLLEGLKGKADVNPRDGVVSVLELLGYAQDRLPGLSREHRTQSQYPIVHAEGMDFPITTVRP